MNPSEKAYLEGVIRLLEQERDIWMKRAHALERLLEQSGPPTEKQEAAPIPPATRDADWP